MLILLTQLHTDFQYHSLLKYLILEMTKAVEFNYDRQID